MRYEDKFKFHSFVSIQKTRNFPFQEWVGETKNDEIIIINYKENNLFVGAGNNEINARKNLEIVGKTEIMAANTTLTSNVNITLEKINSELKLEWVFPSGMIEE